MRRVPGSAMVDADSPEPDAVAAQRPEPQGGADDPPQRDRQEEPPGEFEELLFEEWVFDHHEMKVNKRCQQLSSVALDRCSIAGTQSVGA